MPSRRPDHSHGVLVVDKPTGESSQDVVTRVRLRLGIRSAGHTGTLDPMATGVLPICIGQATKIVQWLQSDDKRYLGECELGIDSDTDDLDGTVVRRVAVPAIDAVALACALARLRASTEQLPPLHSAIWRDGRRMHELARVGIAVAPIPRPIRIDTLTVLAIEPPRLRFEIACSKGTYVRAVVRDLGQLLGSGAVLTQLRRVSSGGFTLADATPVAALDRKTATAVLIPTARALGIAQVEVPDHGVADVIRGRLERLVGYASRFVDGERFQLVTSRGDTLAICERRDARTWIHRVLTYDRGPAALDGRASVPQSPPSTKPGHEPGPE
jgi:tRNA pseudouridine55 synthase